MRTRNWSATLPLPLTLRRFFARAKAFQRETEKAFSFGGRQIARAERIEAGFTEEELDEIEELARSPQGGPRRETLIAAAELLRDRHRARLRGEEVQSLGEPA